MQLKSIDNSSCRCTSKVQLKDKKSLSPILTGILIAIIPKCPLCIVAYSSALTMCSGAKLYHHAPTWTSYLLLGLALFTFIFILINYKGKRTIIASILVLLGSALILASQVYTFDVHHYYLGTLFLMIGVWVNASFRFFYRKYIIPLFAKLVPKRLVNDKSIDIKH